MILWTVIVLLSVLADRFSKMAVVAGMKLNQSFDVIPGIINFRFIRNSGAAWGMLSDNRWVFISFTVIALIVMPVFLYKYRRLHVLFGISISLIIGGGIGNMIDRLFDGSVVDFIEFSFVSFPVFNVADACVTVGAVLLGVYIIFFDTTFFRSDSHDKNKTVIDVKENDSTSNSGT